jgi:tRNA uridine 5-carboxymethylaminomethyl modification enzyme
MIDDLVTRGVSEPYRMFTSRAEYRLTLRADNADQRLTDRGSAIGCVGPERAAAWGERKARLAAARALAREKTITPDAAARFGVKLNRDGVRRSAFDLLALPDIGVGRLAAIWPEFSALDADTAEQLETDAAYAVYLDRQAGDIAAFRRDEELALPAEIDFMGLPGISFEVRQKLDRVRPATLGQAGRMDGVTPAALTLLAAHVRRRNRAVDAA